MLELDGVTLARGAFRLRADLSVPAGARIAVMGPSGAGKSTLIEAIAGFTDLTAGQIRWSGRDMSRDAPGDRPIAMLFQDGNLFPHLTLWQNVGLGISPRLRLKPQDRTRIEEAMARVGLSGMGTRRPADLSGGQRSRAALARVLVQNRPVLLLDEPFAALGPAMRADMLDLVEELAQETGATLLMITHDPADARRITPLSVLVSDGAAHAPADTHSLLDNPPPALQAYLG